MVKTFREWLVAQGFTERRAQIISSHLTEGVHSSPHLVAQQLYRRFRNGGGIPLSLIAKAKKLKHRRKGK